MKAEYIIQIKRGHKVIHTVKDYEQLSMISTSWGVYTRSGQCIYGSGKTPDCKLLIKFKSSKK